MDATYSLYKIQNSRESEEGPDAMEQVFSALAAGKKKNFFASLFRKKAGSLLSFEIISVNSRIYFFIGSKESATPYVESQITAQYPKITFSKSSDYVSHFFSLPHAQGQLVLSSPYYLPLKTYKDLKDLDILASVLGQMAKLPAGQAVSIQICLEPAGPRWQRTAQNVVARGVADPARLDRIRAHPQASLIATKITQVGFYATIRLLVVAKSEEEASSLLGMLAGAFTVYSLGEGNSFVLSCPSFIRKKATEKAFAERSSYARPKHQVLNVSELASVWHPPGAGLAMIKNISWGGSLTGEAPENLSVPTEEKEEKRNINFFARTEFKNRITTFGIKKDDRSKHFYIIGKTGTGKSTLIANMAINDMRNGEGLAVIDPHGDLSEILLDYIPSFRINDVAYLDPSDTEYPFRLNPLEVTNDAYRELVVSGIVSIFYKLYHYSWGPRLEYILRNTLLTLVQVHESTLLDVPNLLADSEYRKKIVSRLEDPVLKKFWLNEYEKMGERLQSEAISPILNKVGQFISARTIRNIIKHPRSTINLEEMMNNGKIIIANLSQGKLGEDNSALLGAMMITKFQLAAMNRVYMEEGKRRDFFLYVDEFQNFATSSFVKILSEARKYHLSIVLANQYIGQIDEEVQKAIFGNIGSLLCFGVGARDARELVREYGSTYTEEELVRLGNYNVVLKLSIDNNTSLPFSAKTLPLPRSKNQNREKVIRSSQERYGKKKEI